MCSIRKCFTRDDHWDYNNGFVNVRVAVSISCAVLCLTVVPPPGKITFLSVKPNSVLLSWGCPKGLEGPASFRVMWGSSMKTTGCLVIRGFHKIEINKLQLGQKYFFRVATEDKDGNLSECVEASIVTGNKRDANTFHVSFTT